MSVQSTDIEPAIWKRPVLVTGAAGFIGSHLVEALLRDGATVHGVDDLDPWYDVAQKRANLAAALRHPRFHLTTTGAADATLSDLWDEVSTVFHLAGRPGVQDSWGPGFEEYARRNVTDTNSVLDAALRSGVERVVLASSSSVYGRHAGPGEDRTPRPISPYGVTKLAAEQLAAVYGERGLDVTCLRYFTVFGPRQRPDMAIHRLIEATGDGPTFVRRGTGEQRREFTYVADVVAATTAAAVSRASVGRSIDVGGGTSVSLNEIRRLVEQLTERPARVVASPSADGDPPTTCADQRLARELLGWTPHWSLADGLAAQVEWHAQRDAASTDASTAAVAS